MTDKPILNRKETAQALGVDVKTLYRWLRSDQCPVPPIPGMSPHKWRAADVKAFVAGGE